MRWQLWTNISITCVLLVLIIMAGRKVRHFVANDSQFTLATPDERTPGLSMRGLVYTSRSRVLETFEADFGRSIFLVPLPERRRRLLAVDWVEDAGIARIWPNRIDVRITERRPVAFINLPVSGGMSSRLLLIDSQGVLLEQPAQSHFKFPVLSGITEEQDELDRRPRVRAMLRLLDDLGSLAKDISGCHHAGGRPRRRTGDGEPAFLAALAKFHGALPGDPQANRQSARVRPSPGRSHYGGRPGAMSGKVFLAVGLDAGASRTRCLVCVIESLRMRCLGYGECPSEGWVKSRIRDQNALTQSVLEALHEAEHRAQVSIESAVVGFGGLTVRGANSRSRIELGRPRAIEQRDVNRALDRASRVQLHEDRMVLQLFAQDFIVEDQAGHRDPRSMLAQRLEANAHLITGSVQEHNCLVAAINQAHVAVEETVFEPVAAHYAAIVPEDRHEGT